MQINNNFKALVLLVSIIFTQGCTVKQCLFNQEKLNALSQEALKYALNNDCFTFQSFSQDTTLNFISVCSDLQHFDFEINTKFIKDQNKNQAGKILEQFDTIKIENWSDRKVYMNPRKEIIWGMDFFEKFSKKIHNSSKSIGFCSFIFSKLILIKSDKGYNVVLKIARYFENIVEYIDLIIETDQCFGILNISCYKPKFEETPHYLMNIPKDRPYSVENIEFYFNKNNVILALNDSFLYQLDQRSIFSFDRYKKVKDNSYISLSPHYCTNDNMDYYQTLIDIQRSDNSIKLVSKDSCETRRLGLSGNVYKQMDFNKDKFIWDSIIIQKNNDPKLKKIIYSNDSKFRYHLLTIDQEVILLTKNIISLIENPNDKKSVFTIKIYVEGKIIAQSSGNKFPYTLNSMYYKFLK